MVVCVVCCFGLRLCLKTQRSKHFLGIIGGFGTHEADIANKSMMPRNAVQVGSSLGSSDLPLVRSSGTFSSPLSFRPVYVRQNETLRKGRLGQVQLKKTASYYPEASVKQPSRVSLISPRIRILRIGRPRMLTAIFTRHIHNTGNLEEYRDNRP